MWNKMSMMNFSIFDDHWKLAYNHYAHPLPGCGIVPFLIEWSRYPSAPSATLR